MKIILTILAASVCIQAAPQPEKSILSDLKDFIQVIPSEQLMEVLDNHLNNDPDFVQVVKYLRSEEFDAMMNDLLDNRQFRKLKNYLRDNGLPIDFMIKFGHHMIANLDPADLSGGKLCIISIMDDIKAVIPFDRFVQIFADKLEHSQEFRNFYDMIRSKRTHELVDNALEQEEVRVMLIKLAEMGVEVKSDTEKLYTFLNWGQPDIDFALVEKTNC